MVLLRGLSLGLAIMLLAGAAQSAERFRPPAVPLVVCDPYFSVWSCADHLYDDWTRHWTGHNNAMAGMIRIDGKAYRFMGKPNVDVPAVEQLACEVLPTRTLYRFAAAGVELNLTFLTPAIPADLDLLSRPVTYLLYDVRATDGKTHDVTLYLDASAEWCTSADDQQVLWQQFTTGVEAKLSVARLGTEAQPILEKAGDNLRIDWGYFHLAAPTEKGTTLAIAAADGARRAFVEQGEIPAGSDQRMPRAANDNWPVMTCVWSLGQVGEESKSRYLILTYDDQYGIQYFGKNLRPYWRRNGMNERQLLETSARELPEVLKRCVALDTKVLADARHAGGEKYAQLCALAWRQCLGAHKLVADEDGTPLYFSKECFSNGCIATVDVTYPSSPFFLLFNPTLLKGQMIPIFAYASSDAWKFPFAPHDTGTYPKANGQVYGDNKLEFQMPVEESGNMLIMAAAICKTEGNADFAADHWDKLTQWAEYLRDNGLDPANQLCTADMFGHLPHNADLSLKTIVAIGGYAQMCAMRGQKDAAAMWRKIAEEYAGKWQEMAKDASGATRLAFDKPGTWGMKHNLVWDRVLGLGLFGDQVGDAEISLYLARQKQFGLPCDNRTPTSLLDWAVWCASLSRNADDFEELIAPLYAYAQQTPSRVPLSDWFVTTDARQQGFQARSVVGGIAMRLLAPAAPGAPRVARMVAAAEASDLPALKPLFDYPLRDTSACLGPDGTYYLTGTTGHPTWWKTNEGIRVWKSRDLKEWTPLGLIWKIDDGTWQKQMHGENRALWAPEIHYIQGTFWLTHCMNFGGCGLLKSSSGKAEGPYVDVHPEGPLTDNIDASLFADDDGKVYFLWQNGRIARLNDDMSALAEEPRQLKPEGDAQVGFEGAFLTKINGRYTLICAEFLDGQYHCMASSSEKLYGPYTKRYVAVPHGGHNMLFKDKQGQWWSTFFGNDTKSPFTERPAILRIDVDAQGRIHPKP